MTSFHPDTVFNIGPMMAESLGKDWCEDRKEIVDYINKFRSWLHLKYPEFELFNMKRYCLRVEKFQNTCVTECGCENFYYGITLPKDIESVSTAFHNKSALKIYSKWFEGREGKIDATNERFGLIDMGDNFVTTKDINEPAVVHIFAHSEQDHEKVIKLNVDTILGCEDVSIKLEGGSVAEIPHMVNRINSVVLPANLADKVTLINADNNEELAEYSPYDRIPNFKRMKLSLNVGCECPKSVEIQGIQKFQKIYFDSDIVEVGYQLIIEAAARMFRYGELGTDSNEIAKSRIEEQKLENLIQGMISRGKGKHKPRGIFKRKITNPYLPGYENNKKQGFKRCYGTVHQVCDTDRLQGGCL